LRQEANDLGSLESLSGKLGKDAPAKADSSLRDDSIQDKTQPGEAFPGVQSQPEAAGAPAAAPESQAPMPAERESGLREEKKQVAPAPMRKMEQSKEADEVQDLAPQAWLEYIIKLRSLSKWDEANAGLARFRQHYPDYPLPDALK
jgi:hypothetical protein